MSTPPAGPTCRIPLRSAFLFVVVLTATLLYSDVRIARAGIEVGASSADFLSFEIGGRSAGMAGAHAGLASGVTAQFWNPAALASLRQSQIGAMHASWLQDLSYEWIGYGRPMGGLGVGSLSVAYFHMPSIQGYDEFDNPTGEIKVYDVALTAGLARAIGSHLSVGANAKLIRQNLASISATGPAVDFGAQARIAGATIGAVVQNLGPELSFDGSSYPLPRQIRLGVARGFLGERLLVDADYNIPRSYYRDLRVGSEVRMHPNISVRVGYRQEFGTSDDPATGLSYGLGLHFGQLELDYALTPSDDFDNVHRLSFGYSFGSGAEEKKPEKPKREKQPEPPPPAAAPAGPRVIASSNQAANPAPAPKPTTVSPAKTPAAAATPTPTVAAAPPPSAPAPEPQRPAPKPAAKPAPAAASDYAVLLPGYWSKESAQAELKALELLGFRVKDAQIEKAPKSGYQVRLARLRSKSGAEEMAASLARMSFRAVVEVVER